MERTRKPFLRHAGMILILAVLGTISRAAVAAGPPVAIFYADSPTSMNGNTTYSVVEAGTSGLDTAYVIFYRSNSTSGNLTVKYTVSGTASNADYSSSYSLTNGITNSIVIPSGSSRTNVTIKALLDTLIEPMETLTITEIPSSSYVPYPPYTNCTLQIFDGTPEIGVYTPTPVLSQGATGKFMFFNNSGYWQYCSNITVNYTVSGTASNGVDYTPALTNSIVIPAGTNLVYASIQATLHTNLMGTKTLTVSVVSNNYVIETNYPSATMGLLPDAPAVSVTGGGEAYGAGVVSGQFMVSRSGGSGTNLVIHLGIGGTAVAGVDYAAIPTNVTLTAGVYSTNLTVTWNTNTVLTAAKTVVLGLMPDPSYLPGLNTNAILTFLPLSSVGNSVVSPAGRYWRGSGTDPRFWSQVIPLDYERGILYSNLNGNAATLYPGLSAWQTNTLYHYDATNALPQTNAPNRIAFNNPIVAFGERVGGTPLYLNQSYSFGLFAGTPFPVHSGTLQSPLPIVITVCYRTNASAVAGYIHIDPQQCVTIGQWFGFQSGWDYPIISTDNGFIYRTQGWDDYVANGFLETNNTCYLADGVQATTNTFGLRTVLASTPQLNWGVLETGLGQFMGQYVLTHTADDEATNYVYLVSENGMLMDMSTSFAMAGDGTVAPSLLYTLEFAPRPPWRSVYIDQPHFDGSPLPPFYAGMTAEEMLTNTPPVTNAVNFAPSAATNLDNSPELRRHPVLDQFVADMGNDPIALANYVLNEIELTDPMDYSDSGTVAEEAVNPPGVSRGALGTYLEKQGSAVEQCALLVYLLRQAGVPAVYEFAPRDGMKMLDERLSRMLQFQIHGSFSEAGKLYTTNTMIAVNYPWVAAYIGTNWVHLFPWLKDYKVSEGLDLWDYMPAQYPNAYLWTKDYIYGATNLLNLATDEDNTPRVIFPKFLEQTLEQNHPGVSVDDLGVQIVNRRHYYSRWADFPTPTWLTNTSTTLENLSASGITNISPSLTNVFDTLSVEIYSVNDPTKRIQTGDLRLADLHNRQFYIHQSLTNSTQVALDLVLMPFRTNITATYGFTNDASLLARQTVSLMLDQYDDSLQVRFRLHRHRALTAAYAIDPTVAFLGLSSLRELVLERPLRKGDQAAICMDYGRVTRDMLNERAKEVWQMEQALRLSPSLTNSLSPDLYLGTPIYLAGMTYYEKEAEFREVNQRLNKVNELSTWAIGLSKMGAARSSSGSLTNGVDPVLPNVDMFHYETAWTASWSLRPDSGRTYELVRQNFEVMDMVNGSAEEHQTINRFYRQTNAVSTVRLLQLSARQGGDVVPISYGVNNYSFQGENVYQGKALKNWDSWMWSQVSGAFASYDQHYVIAYMTPGPVTNSAYKGMGALILGWNQYAALISPDNMNGAFGENLANNTWAVNQLILHDLAGGNNLSMQLAPPKNGTALANNNVTAFNFQNNINQILSGDVIVSSIQAASLINAGSLLGTGYQNPSVQTYAINLQTVARSGYLIPGDFGTSSGTKVADPVHTLTGEFLVDETDLLLPGPFPLPLRRNYSSQNLADNQFGTGWKSSLMPYLSVSDGETNIYAAEMDGAVLTYVNTGTNVWLPTLAANPQLNNNASAGVGVLANRLRNRLVRTTGTTTNYTLYGADGSVRSFQMMTFDNGILNISRPYLLRWIDSQGNGLSFSYGTDSTQPNFAQVRRIQADNGNFLGFTYDIYGHVTEAYTGDRRVDYEYDDYGDLTTVTLPDASTRSYVYQLASQPVTNGMAFYSTHLIIEEDKPDGRKLVNYYDDQRRVTNQWSTAGSDLTPVRTSTFIYSNNFNSTNYFTNTISGITWIVDAHNYTNRYDYTNNLITRITDPLGQTVQQTWYPDNATAPGYPRSVALSVDVRGLTNQFFYDSSGNVTQRVVIGDLTGDGIATQSATNSALYGTNNLPTQMTDATGNRVDVTYDATFPFLPGQIVRSVGGTAIGTNRLFYGNATNTVVNGYVTQTNRAFGLLTRTVRAWGSSDAATNDFVFDGRGFPKETIAYTSTGDPAVTSTLVCNNRGEVVERGDAAGRRVEFGFDGLSRPIWTEVYEAGQTQPEWRQQAYYNDNGELEWVDGPRYGPEDYVWFDHDGAGRVTTEIRWRSQAKADGSGVEAPAGYDLYSQTFREFDALGNLKRTVDPRGASTTNSWDALGRLTHRDYLETNGVTLASESFAYEPGGQVRFVTNALSGVTERQYTTAGQIKYQKNADGSTNAWRYWLDGRIRREILGNGSYWEITYDDAHRQVSRVFHAAAGTPLATNVVVFDRRGNVMQTVDAAGNVFTNLFDGLNRLKIAAGPVSQSVSISFPEFKPVTNYLRQIVTNFYDSAGAVMTNANALGETTITFFDALGRVTRAEIRDATGALVRERSVAYSADQNSVTVTNGSGANAIVATTYSDTFGAPLMSVGYPCSGVREYALNDYDLSGNLIFAGHYSATNGAVALWTTNRYSYDGLNRLKTETSRDGAVTTYYRNALGNLTQRSMPGGLQWNAIYSAAGQMQQNWLTGSGGSGTRTNSYTYYPAGTPWAGLMQTMTDARGVYSTYTYDDYLRSATNTQSWVSPFETTTTFWQYDARGLVTTINHTSDYNQMTVDRSYDAYGQLVGETLSSGGIAFSHAAQTWNAAGRRSLLDFGGFKYGFGWRPDGSLGAVATPVGGSAYGYDTAGMLTNRVTGNRQTSITSRDGMGRTLTTSTKLNGAIKLTESLSWTGDGLLSSHSLQREDFTDSRAYFYGPSTRRLIEERLSLDNTRGWTNEFAYDGGQASGPGVLTRVSQPGGSNIWSGATDDFARLSTQTNLARRVLAHGRLNGRATVTATLDGQPQPLTVHANGDANWTNQWRSTLDLLPGAHRLAVSAAHPSGLFTTNTSVWFTNNLAGETVSDLHDPAGNTTLRVWRTIGGTTNRTQTLEWDAFNRLTRVVELDAQENGYDWGGGYDALSRQTYSYFLVVTNGFYEDGDVRLIVHYYDPQAQFQEMGVYVEGQTTWKVYGPDLDGNYAGMSGTGGLDALSPGTGQFQPLISDARGNVLGVATNGVVAWNPSRPTGYGAVPGWRPTPIGGGTPLAQNIAWRGRWPDVMGWVNLGARYYDPVAGSFLNADPAWNGRDPNYYTFCGGDPINYFDPLGLCSDKNWLPQRFPGQPGTGYPLDKFYTYAGSNPVGWDNFDRYFHAELAEATSMYPFGSVPPTLLDEARQRGYVSMWDMPIGAGSDARGTVYAMDVKNLAIWTTLSIYGEAMATPMGAFGSRPGGYVQKIAVAQPATYANWGGEFINDFPASRPLQIKQPLLLTEGTLESRVGTAYQEFYNVGWQQTVSRFNQGQIPISAGQSWRTVLGQQTDAQARQALLRYLQAEGITEGRGGQVLVNRRLYDPSGSGTYRIPDVRIPSEGVIFDGTIGTKTLATPQILDFINWSGSRVNIVSPTVLPRP